MTEKLKPCPFCGGEAIGFEWSDDDECEGCFLPEYFTNAKLMDAYITEYKEEE